MSERLRRAVLICHDCFWQAHYGRNHPLSIPRVSLAVDLIRAYGALEVDEWVTACPATDGQLQWFHHPTYIDALRTSERDASVNQMWRVEHNFGNAENPFFKHIFSTPATATGASIQGAELVIAGLMAFNPAGGMHHGEPGRARGFCFFNDPVLAIIRLRQHGWRVLYLDIDAHHGDGVEAAFKTDPAVLTMSLHMDTRYAYPFSGGSLTDHGELGNALNIPLPVGCNDAEYHHLFDALWPAALERFKPDVVVLQAGTDALMTDPLGKLRLTTQGFLEVVAKVMETAPRHSSGIPRLLVLGGGGYQPLALARCWAGLWALLSGRVLPERMPATGVRVLRSIDWDLDEDEAYFEQFFISHLDQRVETLLRDEIASLSEYLLGNHPLWH